MSKILDKIKKLPLAPGVYMFIGRDKKPLYIGKATSLRRRVESYPRAIDPRIKEMVSLAKDIRFYETDSVLEAIILEANLIKKHWPKYNIKEKDDRSFVYIAISKKDDFPKPIIIRGQKLSNFPFPISHFTIFGPYQSMTVINNALKIIRKIFPYSTCKYGQGKPCFYYQIGLCPGVCVNGISKKDYKKNINNIVLLLNGKKKQLLEKLKNENPGKARALQHIQDVSLLTNDQRPATNDGQFSRIEGYDISHLSGKETYGSMVVFSGNEPDKNEYRLFKIKTAVASDDLNSLTEVIERRFKHNEWQKPDLIMIDGGTPQISHIQKVLDKLDSNIQIVGISKYAGDELVFPLKTKKSDRNDIKNIKDILLRVRDEAHRFALKSSRRKRKII